MLVLNARFPRSLLFCVRALRRHLEAATAQTPRHQTLRAFSELAVLELDLAATDEGSLIRDGLHEFLDRFQQRVGAVNAFLAEDVFHVLPAAVR